MNQTDLNFNYKELNKIRIDRYGIVSAFLAINKPIHLTSHSIVSEIRKQLGTRSVGHAGTLDPFATGVLIVLVGKKYTKLSETFLSLDKTYKMRILLGVQSETLDTETPIKYMDYNFAFPKKSEIEDKLKEFEGGYAQLVPIFSSVKVNGKKLRILARGSESYEYFTKQNKTFVKFHNFNGENLEVQIPVKEIKVYDIKLLGKGKLNKKGIELKVKVEAEIKEVNYIDVEFSCSKGTYARQFAADLANKLKTKGMLIELERTRIGDITLLDCIDVKDVNLNTDQSS